MKLPPLSLILFLFLIPSVQAITIQQGISFNTTGTNTTYIAGANFTVDSITVTQNLLNITNSSTGDFIISATPSSGPLNITILGFNASYKKFNISSNTSGITASFVIGNITPVSALMVFLKNGAYWNTFTSNASGYINFTYSEGNSNIQFEALQDISAPTVSLSLSSSSIYQGQSITITCSASDNYQVSSASLTIAKPSGSTTATCNQPFTDTSASGTYTVTYSATDTSGNSASTSQAFMVGPSGGSGGSGSAITQNKTNQMQKNATAVALAPENRTNATITPPAEPEMKVNAQKKISEAVAKAGPEDLEARRLISEAEAAYALGDYSEAYRLALEAEGLIGKNAGLKAISGTEKKPSVLYYAVALVVLAVVGVYRYKWAQKSEGKNPTEISPIKERTALKSEKQAPKPKDADLDDIQRRLEEIKRKLRE